MSSARLALLALCLHALAACGLLADKPEAAPPPPPEPSPAPAPVIETPPPPPPAPPPKPVVKTRPAAKPAKTARAGATPPAAEASAPAPVVAKPPPRKQANPAPQGPAWLQYCSFRQQSPTGILCDANSLLAQPSAKVQVYVREAALARDTPGGRIQLREGLPRLYRFFVIP